MLVVLPFWTSFLIRIYAWMGLLSENGILNQFLRGTGLVADPGTILGTDWAVHLGIVYAYLPFMVLPLYATLEKLDSSLLEAAADLGARPLTAFLTDHPAAVAARHRRRLPAGVHPRGRRVRDPRPAGRHRDADDRQGAVGRVLHQLATGRSPRRWRSAACCCWSGRSCCSSASSSAAWSAAMNAARRFAFTVLAFGYAFLYLPIALVMVYSFNESRLVTVWAGFSTKWWSALFANEAMLSAAFWLSLRIAFVSATRRDAARPRCWLCARPRAALPRPHAVRRPGHRADGDARGGDGHLHAAAVRRQRAALRRTGARLPHHRDRATSPSRWPSSPSSCRRGSPSSTARSRKRRWTSAPRPGSTFRTVTLPLIAPALASGWLLAFTLSLDDLILTQFVAGAQSQTLPMRVYSSVRLGVDPQINVLATIVVCVAASALILSGWLTRRKA